MGRTTVYNVITTPELISQISQQNTDLLEEFIDYLSSIDRSPKTISQYKADLSIFFVWNLSNNKNKFFIDLTKREFMKFQNHTLNKWGWSPKRIRRVKSVISSLSDYIENMLDEEEEFKNFKSIIKKIPNPENTAIREKSIIPDNLVDHLIETLVSNGQLEQACMVSLSANSGMRISELIQMKVDYFNDDNIGEHGLWETPKIRTKGSGKLGKQLSKYIMYDFKPYLDLWLQKRKELGIESEWLFVSKKVIDGELTWNPRTTVAHWTKQFTTIIDMPFYFHAMRHYTCTKLARNNLPSSIIVGFFGWESESMLKIYNDMTAEDEFGKYFSKDGIKKVEQGSLSDM
jgi:Site-specific recombinase XerD